MNLAIAYEILAWLVLGAFVMIPIAIYVLVRDFISKAERKRQRQAEKMKEMERSIKESKRAEVLLSQKMLEEVTNRDRRSLIALSLNQTLDDLLRSSKVANQYNNRALMDLATQMRNQCVTPRRELGSPMVGDEDDKNVSTSRSDMMRALIGRRRRQKISCYHVKIEVHGRM